MSRTWTEEEKKAFGEKMKAARLKKQTNEAVAPTAPELPKETTVDKKDEGVTLTTEQFNQLMERLSKVEGAKTTVQTQTPVGQGFDSFGKPVGIMQRYSLDPAHYKDPREALYESKELKRHAIRENYMLTWDVDQLIYDTKYGTSMSDPKFTLTLYRKKFNEDGTESGKRILIQTGVFFEDPSASIKEAIALGISVDNANSPEFLEQMRYHRYKQWLLDIFNPSRLTSTKPKTREEVIGGKVYTIEDYSVVV